MTLGEYIRALVAFVDVAEPLAGARLRAWVGRRRARISLDDEAVEVMFDPAGRLHVYAPSSGAVDGAGVTSRSTVMDLLAGRLEATDAILDGLIDVEGEPAAVIAILAAIEILIDVSTRNPGLRALADAFVQETEPAGGRAAAGPAPVGRRTPWLPAALDPLEVQLLADLGIGST
jgi:hypothetical protein